MKILGYRHFGVLSRDEKYIAIASLRAREEIEREFPNAEYEFREIPALFPFVAQGAWCAKDDSVP